jgi:hypothetical protein
MKATAGPCPITYFHAVHAVHAVHAGGFVASGHARRTVAVVLGARR